MSGMFESLEFFAHVRSSHGLRQLAASFVEFFSTDWKPISDSAVNRLLFLGALKEKVGISLFRCHQGKF